MKKLILILLMGLVSTFVAVDAQAALLDLSSWTEVTLDLGGQPVGDWVLSSGNTEVTQIINADPSFYLNNLNQTNYLMQGSWSVETTSDNDFMGFVFGHQDNSHFYLMDWKQGQQNYVGTTAQEGFSLKKISASSVSDLTLADFWSSAGTTNTTILDTFYGSSAGWVDLTSYDFFLDFKPGQFSVTVKDGTTELWNSTVNDSTYTYGQFGFYNFSQQQVKYAGFVQEGGEIIDPVIPEPATIFLFGTGILGVLARKRKK